MSIKMNREILFRGKRLDNSEWAYGVPVSDENIVRIAEIKSVDEITEFLVDPKTVGQYTGLTDKNGVKVFEGDIVERNAFYPKDEVRTGIVEYDEEYGAFFIVGSGYSDNQLYAFCNSKVVGNVFDNPEFMEENEDETD